MSVWPVLTASTPARHLPQPPARSIIRKGGSARPAACCWRSSSGRLAIRGGAGGHNHRTDAARGGRERDVVAQRQVVVMLAEGGFEVGGADDAILAFLRALGRVATRIDLYLVGNDFA